MFSLTFFPLLALSLISSVFIAVSSYNSSYNAIYTELNNMCVGVCELVAPRGLGFSESDSREIGLAFSSICESTGIDLTIFEGDVRVITTVHGEDGVSAVGTKASPEVANEVLVNGNDFFSQNADINGNSYYGYYKPIVGEDGTVIGMTFAGKSRSSVTRTMILNMIGLLAVSWAIMLVVAAISISTASGMVKSLSCAADFLRRISCGDTDCVPPAELTSRKDEIGDMGRAAAKLQRSLKSLISTDPLTGLLNRRACNLRLGEMLRNAQSNAGHMTVVIGDIDFFKSFNDKYGHACGDIVLKDISEILSKGAKGKGIVSRWGGEEFLLAFDIPDNEASAVMNEIMEDIRAYSRDYNGVQLGVTMTFGIQHYTSEESIDAIVNSADKKLYYGKNNGRDRIVELLT